MAVSWHTLPDTDTWATALSDATAAILGAAIARNGRAGLAVSGGRSPIPYFEALSRTRLPWGQVDLTLVDERFVPPSHPDSNEHLVRAYLLHGLAREARFTGLVGIPGDLPGCVAQANQNATPLTLTVLGMGEDGHTASLFPGASQLEEGLDPASTARYVHVTPPAAPHERISMTLSSILSSDRIIIAIAGQTKRAVLERAMQGASLPISRVVNKEGAHIDVYWHP